MHLDVGGSCKNYAMLSRFDGVVLWWFLVPYKCKLAAAVSWEPALRNAMWIFPTSKAEGSSAMVQSLEQVVKLFGTRSEAVCGAGRGGGVGAVLELLV